MARASLGARLRPKYAVRTEERVYVSDENDPGRSVIVPDLRVASRPGWPARAMEEATTEEIAVAEPIVATTLIDDEIHESRIEVIDRENGLVVTVIEVLSPSNKVPGARGRSSYLEKRQEIMNSASHLVELDLLRGGQGITVKEAIPACEYLAHVSRVQKRPKGLLWPIRLAQRLPVIPIPLRGEDPDAPLDLQEVLSAAYQRAGYDLSVDYRKEPVPTLSGDWGPWSDRLLKEKGLRPF